MDSYGYLYDVTFDPSYPAKNLLTSDNDSAGNGQFRISRSLLPGRRYVLVVTTDTIGVTGSFWIRAVGPASVGLTSITLSSE